MAGHLPLIVFFVVATPLWSIFVIQDFVLTGIRRAALVPAENLVFSILRSCCCVVAAVVAVPGGIALSWVVSVALIVVGVNGWLLVRGLPRHGRDAADRAVPITLGGIARFVRADYAGAVFWQCALFGLPVPGAGQARRGGRGRLRHRLDDRAGALHRVVQHGAVHGGAQLGRRSLGRRGGPAGHGAPGASPW